MAPLQTANPQSGFIALISAIIISVVLLAIAATLSLSGFYTRFNILDSEYKKRSLGLAEACAETALLDLANNINYTLQASDGSVPVGTDTCAIVSISPGPPRSGPVTIVTKGIFPSTGPEQAHSNIKVIIDSTTLNINSWVETP